MATLTEVSIISRKAIRYGIYLIILIVIVRSGFNIGKSIYNRLFPPPPPPVNPCFGPLSILPMPQVKPESAISYTLETPEGTLPTFPDRMNVYFMPPYAAGINNEEVAKNKAKALGFNPNGKVEAENLQNVYRFQKDNVPSTMIMNIINGIFSISYDIPADPTVVTSTSMQPADAIRRVQDMLNNAGILAGDLTAPPKADLLKYENGKLNPADSLSDANLVKVNIFRKTFEDKYPSMTFNPNQSNIWFLLSTKDIIAAEYRYFPIDESKKCENGETANYSIKTAQEAWDDLKNGNGFIASLGDVKGGEVKIRKVYLAYFDAGQYVEFYQPIVVFEGVDNGFVAYVPAITSEYYKEKAQSEQ